MKASQIPFYMACPIFYWPWLWLQFRRIDRWMADRLARGEAGCILLHLGPRGTLFYTFVSDNLRDDTAPCYAKRSFESLTWPYYPEWMYSVAGTLVRPRCMGDGTSKFLLSNEISDALRPIP